MVTIGLFNRLKKKNLKAKQKPKYERTIKQASKRQNTLVGCQSVTLRWQLCLN